MEKCDEISKKLKKKLSEDRYRHTLGVANTACSLAMCYGSDYKQAYLAGLLHDCAKYGGSGEKIEKCREAGIPVTESERKNPSLLHAKLGAFYAKECYGVEDEEILSAIRCHTTGKPAMTLLEKILFTADYIEPTRDKAPRLTKIRKMAFEDLDTCVLFILQDTIDYLHAKENAVIDPVTEEAFSYYQKQQTGTDL